ncbi:hypothetical protein [Streptosporangium minutum]|uniref:Uncharacterized protein n=1 Tax=Streptosporangium minutum TaxID=569862 RepID=A0A243RX76_9ACTN|nr:hypothetical protein [Streptosporangium minutum]OUC99786.1 hypothetical protein CA984_01725 [Streptosporangium minutum]
MTFLIQRFNTAPAPSLPEESDIPAFTSPALGEAFDFTVAVRLSRLPSDRRSQWVPEREETDRVSDLVRQTVRATTRRHSIFEPDTAEAAVNEALDRCLAGVTHTDPAIICRWGARAEIGLPEEVKEIRRAHLLNMYEIEARAEATKLRVEKLRDSSAVWEGLLSEATGSSFARYAVRLTEDPENAAGIFEQMLDARKEEAGELLKLVAEIVAAQRTAGIYDLVLASDNALRQAFERLGVPLPPADPDSMFAPLDEIS